jgi:NAD(P)-dependent dehydrogenase (short-subunit alcohol dehydrogenase family)
VQRRFDGKTFMVTGAGTGFGAALSQRAAQEGAAKALAPTVRVNTFTPGFMETEALLNRRAWQAGRREVALSGTPAGKIPKPEEMTGAALFPASEDAHHVTGSYMIADGGYSMLGA